ncbi:MAG: thioredoxin domain-containing protein [Terracidiphilus sp.]
MIHLTEVVDYQCPYCRQLNRWTRELPQNLTDRLLVSYLNFPLPMHNWARSAALAAICAEQQGPIHLARVQERLYALQSLGPAMEIKPSLVASQLNDNSPSSTLAPANAECFSSATTVKRLEKELALADELHIAKTPTIFLNGNRVEVTSEDEFHKALTEAQDRPKRN